MAKSHEKEIGDECWRVLVARHPSLLGATEVAFRVENLRKLVSQVAAKAYVRGRKDANADSLFGKLFGDL